MLKVINLGSLFLGKILNNKTIFVMKRLIQFFQLSEVFGYFVRVFQKPDPSRPNTSYLRMMHGINRISIIMFLFCIGVMLYRFFTR